MSQQTGVKKPQIRFKAFNDGWKLQPLGSATRLDNGFAFKSRFFSRKQTNVIVVTPGSVHIGGGFQEGKGQFYDPSEVVPEKYKFQPGDIFVTMTDLTPTAQALGFPARIPDDGNTYLHNQRLGKLMGFDGDEEFLFQLLSTENYHHYIATTSSGTTVKHSSPQKILSFEAHFPSLPEQTGIGAYFKSLDRMIGLHQRKHDKLVTLKQAMLQKMFPQDGATTPEIRCKGFEEPWQKKRVGQLFRVTRGDVLAATKTSPKKTNDAPYPVYSSQTKNNGLMGYYHSFLFEDAITWTTDGANAGTVCFRVGKFYSTNVNGVLLSDEGYANSAVAEALNLEAWRHVSHVGNPKLMNNVMSEIEIWVPSTVKEQQTIGSYFCKFDELKSKHAKQIEKLKNIKSACLDKMFV